MLKSRNVKTEELSQGVNVYRVMHIAQIIFLNRINLIQGEAETIYGRKKYWKYDWTEIKKLKKTYYILSRYNYCTSLTNVLKLDKVYLSERVELYEVRGCGVGSFS